MGSLSRMSRTRRGGDVFDEDDERADEKVVRFLNLEKLPDDKFTRFEDCVGCREHVKTARLFQDQEGAGNYMRRSGFPREVRSDRAAAPGRTR